jgi:hypothetical protein
MARFGYSFAVPAGSQVTVYQSSSSSIVLPDTLFADRSSGATLTNPFTVAGTLASFFLQKSQQINIGVKSPSGSAPTVVAAATGAPVAQYGTHKRLSDNSVMDWFQT